MYTDASSGLITTNIIALQHNFHLHTTEFPMRSLQLKYPFRVILTCCGEVVPPVVIR